MPRATLPPTAGRRYLCCCVSCCCCCCCCCCCWVSCVRCVARAAATSRLLAATSAVDWGAGGRARLGVKGQASQLRTCTPAAACGPWRPRSAAARFGAPHRDGATSTPAPALPSRPRTLDDVLQVLVLLHLRHLLVRQRGVLLGGVRGRGAARGRVSARAGGKGQADGQARIAIGTQHQPGQQRQRARQRLAAPSTPRSGPQPPAPQPPPAPPAAPARSCP